jgi:superfamily I DNA/RNA helicase
VKLETNYRSGPRICDAANKLIAHNTARVEKWSITSEPDKQDEVSAISCGTEMGECEFIANCIRRFMEQGYAPREIAVLARYNMLARQIREYLVRADIPVMSQARREQVDGTTPSDMDAIEAERVEAAGNWAGGGGVTVSTIHGMKGAEAEVVFVAGCEEGQLPGRGDAEENRRLCYVAMTRAKSKLILTYAKQRFQYGTMTTPNPSRFLREGGLL